jgi:DNA modification methylase
MNFLHTEIGSAKDNQASPIHNWYKFTAGFSYKFVEEIIKLETLKRKKTAEIFDPFAGCGTTLVSSQKEGVRAVGNESQAFMYDVIKAKLNWNIKSVTVKTYLEYIKVVTSENRQQFPFADYAHPLLASLYKTDNLKELYLIKLAISEIQSEAYRLFFKLALSQTLHKVSIHPIAIPYIVRTKTLHNTKSALDVFVEISQFMLSHTESLPVKTTTSKIYRQDSRRANRYIDNNQCNVCITSPPYLNNLDYGEISKVHTHFFDITKSWNDITKNVRRNLVTGATTHYVDSQFSVDNFLTSDFALSNKAIVSELLETSHRIKSVAKDRSGKKSFDILALLYFKDMSLVLSEIRRVLKPNGTAYLILGDSAPYGVHIPTTRLMGRIARNMGYSSFRVHKIRSRGTKWKSLKYRHSLELTENVLVLK